MSRKAMVAGIVLLISIWSGSVSWGISAGECIEQGRAEMFPCTLSGMRLAYQTFDDCLDDPGCVDCSSNRELIFLHALTQTAMLVVRDNAGEPNSVLEIAKLFDLELLGDDCNNLDYTYPTNEHDYYEIPQGAPDASEISALVKSWMIPEIDEIMAELNSISDLPCDHSFRIYFEPSETGLEGNLEVDYGEVLILKGGLLALRARLQAQAAYDIFVSEDYKLGERIYSGCVDVNDLLNTHPDLFMVLPTANDANDGVAALVQARQDWIDSINYYLDAIDCIRSEDDPPGTDPQDDELVYIDPNDEFFVDTVNGKLIHLRESLVNDTVATYAVETTKTYDVYDASPALIGQLVLVYDFIDAEGEDGSLTFIDGGPAPSPWEVEWHDREETWLEVDVEYYSEGGWREGYFEGTLSPDGSSITNAKFEYWGSDYGTLNNLSGQIVGTEVEYANVDLNPVFGSSARYPQPVNPRDLLPVFDEWNGPQPDTVGHGLGDDATLGGILPDMTQYDWQILGDVLQPGGLFYIDSINPGQITIDGNMNDWTSGQLVLDDISGDTEEESSTIQGVDIDKLYMAYDSENLYGGITFFDNINNETHYWYDLYLSYSLDEDEALHSIHIDIEVDNGNADGTLYFRDNYYGQSYWKEVASFNAAAGPNAIEFEIPLGQIAGGLSGRFITIESGGWNPASYEWDGEWNGTHLKIAEVGSIAGTVSYDGYTGAPVFVQAYTKLCEPEDSLVACTMVTEPGPYTLEGVGLNWQGYVRAFTPLFGFDNPLELEAFDIESSIAVSLSGSNVNGADLVLNDPCLLETDVWVDGEINGDLWEEDWYAFDAEQDGVYTLHLTRGTAAYACMSLYGRDGNTELGELYYWQTQQINWDGPVSGRYYIKVANGDYQDGVGAYQIRMCEQCPCLGDIDESGQISLADLDAMVNILLGVGPPFIVGCPDIRCDCADFDSSGQVTLGDLDAMVNLLVAAGPPFIVPCE